MKRAYFIVRPLWWLLPDSVRDNAAMQWAKNAVKQFLLILVRHNEIYTEEFFAKKVDPPADLVTLPVQNYETYTVGSSGSDKIYSRQCGVGCVSSNHSVAG